MWNKIGGLKGRRFGRLRVLGENPRRHGKLVMWDCVCDCGKKHLAAGRNLVNGCTKSCGCLARENRAKANFTHGLSGDPLYYIWAGMRDRCNNKNSKFYKYYGARGITVCKRWNKFENFYMDMHPRPLGLTIDRINNNRGYSPKNCRWVEQRAQVENRRTTRLIKGKTAAQWSRECGVPESNILYRVGRGWPWEKVVSCGRHYYRGFKLHWRGLPLTDFCLLANIKYASVLTRLRKGMSMDDATEW